MNLKIGYRLRFQRTSRLPQQTPHFKFLLSQQLLTKAREIGTPVRLAQIVWY